MAGGIIIGGRLNLTVSFISSLSSPGYLPPALPLILSPSLSLSFRKPLPPVLSRLPTPFPPPSPFSFALSEFCAELPAIIIIALLPIISTTPLRNCTSMLLIHFLFGQRGEGRSRWTRSRKFRCVISAPLSRLTSSPPPFPSSVPPPPSRSRCEITYFAATQSWMRAKNADARSGFPLPRQRDYATSAIIPLLPSRRPSHPPCAFFSTSTTTSR